MSNISPVNQIDFTATYAAMRVEDPTPKTSRIQRVAKRVFNFLFRVFLFPGASLLKFRLDMKRLERSKTQLESIGGKRLTLKTPDGDRIDGMYLRAADFQHLLNTYFDRHIDKKSGHMTLILKGEYTEYHYDEENREHFHEPNAEAIELIKLLDDIGIKVYESNPIPGRYKSYGCIIQLGLQPENLPQVAPIDNETSEPTVLFAPGSGGTYMCYKKLLIYYLLRGINVMTVDYRGYGKSKGTPSDEKIKLDLETAYQYLVQERHIENKDLLVHGHCFGGGPASEVAARHEGVNILLDRTFPTYGDVAEENFPSIKSIIRRVLPSIIDFNVAENLEHVTGHIAIEMGKKDHLISETQTMKLINHLPYNKKGQVETLMYHDGDHNELWVNKPETTYQFDRFLEQAHLRRAL